MSGLETMLSDRLSSVSDRISSVETALCEYMPEYKGIESRIYEAARYSLLAGGKRIRPVLLLEFASLFKADEKRAMPFACALEFIHTYSLIHDDLPCMDNDELRRGKPTNHMVYGEAMALLAGDALLNRAYEIMLAACLDQSESSVRAAAYIASCAGVRGMVGGQAIDLLYEGRPASEEIISDMHSKKTGALIRAACVGGALLEKADEGCINAAADYAAALGLAFQIKDDILDVEGDMNILGKRTGSDNENNKTTYVTLYGLDRAKEAAKMYTDKALAALERLPKCDFLKDFTKSMLCRNH